MRLIIMFVCIAFAAGAFFITMHFTSKPPEQQMPVVEPRAQVQEIETVDVYTAKDDIPIGTVITQEMLDLRPWPKKALMDDMVVVDSSHPPDVLKMVVRTPFQKGEPIITTKLANPNDPSFLASSLAQGMRLVTIAVDVVSGAGGFVFPGDRVDVLVTHDVITGYTLTDNGGDPSTGGAKITSTPVKEPTTEVLASDIRVMATNQKSTAHGGDLPVPPQNISLEVTPEVAQKINLAENGNGRLSLVLRSLKDISTPTAIKPSDLTDLSVVKATPNPDSTQVTIVRGIHTQSVGVLKP